DEIARLLARLHPGRQRMHAIDVAVVPVSALGLEGDDLSPWLPAEHFDEALGRAGDRGRVVSVSAYDNQRVSELSGRRRATVTDTEVNQTGIIPVVNPTITELPLGLSINATPRAIPGTSLVEIELEVFHIRQSGESETRETLFADIELVPLAEDGLSTSLVIPRNGVALAGLLDEPTLADAEPKGFAVLLRARTREIALGEAPDAPAPPDANAFRLELHDVSFLVAVRERAWPLFSEDLLAVLIRHNVARDAWFDGR